VERHVLVRRTALGQHRTVTGEYAHHRRALLAAHGERVRKYDRVVYEQPREDEHQRAARCKRSEKQLARGEPASSRPAGWSQAPRDHRAEPGHGPWPAHRTGRRRTARTKEPHLFVVSRTQNPDAAPIRGAAAPLRTVLGRKLRCG